jgi:iron-sulfur cluster insertion protein
MEVATAFSTPDMIPPTPLSFSAAAAAKVQELIAEEGNTNLKLRLYGVTLVVDAMSLQYLVGADIDYEDGLEGSRFVIHNPNAQTTCGCGSSFSM